MNASTLLNSLAIGPLARPAHAVVHLPGSKSITNRALVLAALANRQQGCELSGVLDSEDTRVMAAALRRLGYTIDTNWDAGRCTIHHQQTGRVVPAENAELECGNSGTTMRFLTALAAAGSGSYRLDGNARMRKRPIGDLIDGLRHLGLDAQSADGFPPVIVRGVRLRGGTVDLAADKSSQFASGLMMAGLAADQALHIRLTGLIASRPYLVMTTTMIRQFGGIANVSADGRDWTVEPSRTFGIEAYAVEPDATAASYFIAAAAITGGSVTLPGLHSDSIQGDIRFAALPAFARSRLLFNAEGLEFRGGPVQGCDVDMGDMSDTVMTLAAAACFAERPTTIRGVAHIRHKESDRLAAMANELRKIGAGVEERPDGLTVHPRPLHAAVLDTYDDHRIAMSLSLIGLRIPGIIIKNPGCVAKTYLRYFDDLERLRA